MAVKHTLGSRSALAGLRRPFARVIVTVALALTGLGLAGVVPPLVESATARQTGWRGCGNAGCDGAPDPANGALQVRVELQSLSGVAPAPGLPTPVPESQPVGGVPVQIFDPARSGVALASSLTDAQGEVCFELPPGSYWVVIPRDAEAPGLQLSRTLARQLPDGTLVRAWADGGVSAGVTTPVELVLTVVQP